MSYKINATNGTLLVDLIDGKLDTGTTDISLIGKNYTGYGEVFNENFIKIMENFANVSPPEKPLTGQLWYDTSDGRLKIFNGTAFRSTDTTVVSSIQPAELLAGDIWVDTANKQLYFGTGSGNPVLAGPIFSQIQGETGFKAETIVDSFGNSKTVAKLMIGDSTVLIISKETFTPAIVQSGFGTSINIGVNVNTNFSEFEFYNTATSARALLDSSNNPYTPENFVRSADNNILLGTLAVKNNAGITVGDRDDFVVNITGNTVLNRVQRSDIDYKIQVRNGTVYTDAITIDASESNIGVWNNNPQYSLDVTGDLRVSGNLLINGSTTSIDVATLRVEDKLIELAITDDSTLLTDSQVDGGGISLRSSGLEKNLTWSNTTNSWTSSCNLAVPAGFAIKIGTQEILTSTSISSSVISATGLTQIGTLQELQVDNINLNNTTVTVTGSPLTIVSPGDIVIANGRKITNIGNPTSPQDAATKTYVDQQFNNDPVYLALDITGYTNTDIASVIESLVPASTKSEGTVARIHTEVYISIGTVTRELRLFTISSGSWVYSSTP